MKKLRLSLIAICLCLLCVVSLASCCSRLDEPAGFYLDTDSLLLRWDKVTGADGYTVLIGEKEKVTLSNSYSLAELDPGEYDIKVKANTSSDGSRDSAYATFAFKKKEESGLLYKLVNNNSEYQLVGVGGADGEVVMEDTFRGKPVTSIAESALSNNSRIISFTVGNNVSSIPKKAFYNCNAMETVIIPETVKSIGLNAFHSCKSLKSVVIPESVTEISDYAFAYCRALESVTMSSATTRIGDYAFSDCTALTGISIPATVTYVGNYAFSNCKLAEYIQGGESVEYIGDFAFYSCELVDEITLSASLESIGESAFSYCTSLTEVTLPDSLKRVGTRAFNFCEKLAVINAGENIESIGRNAFQGTVFYDGCEDDIVYLGNWILACRNTEIRKDEDLTPIIRGGTVGIAEFAFLNCTGFTGVTLNDVKYIGDYAFYNCTNLMELKLSSPAEHIGDFAFAGCSLLSSVLIGNSSVEYIGDYAFNGCKRLKSINLPDTVTTIGTRAFDATGLPATVDGVVYADNWLVGVSGAPQNVTVSSGTVGIADYAFFQCGSLSTVKLPDSLEVIGRGAFMLCERVSIAQFSASLREIDDYAFYGCKGASFGVDNHLVLPDGLERIGRSAFYQTAICGLELPDSCKYVDDYAFFDCPLLGNIVEYYTLDPSTGELVSVSVQYQITLGEGIEHIGSRAFALSGINEISIPASVKFIGERAFVGCKSLTAVTVDADIATLPAATFSGCTALESVALSDGIVEVGSKAFRGCTALTDITLGSNLQTVGDYAFLDCESLESVSLPDSVTSVGTGAFRGLDAATSITLTDSVGTLGDFAFYGAYLATVYSESLSAQEGWSDTWNSSYRPLILGCTLSDEGYVVSFTKDNDNMLNTDAVGGISAPARSGYVFAGWSTEQGGAIEYEITDTMNAPDGQILYAIWQEEVISEGNEQ